MMNMKLLAVLTLPSIYQVPLTQLTTQQMYSMSEAYTLQNNTTIYGQVISAGELVVKAQYIFSVQ